MLYRHEIVHVGTEGQYSFGKTDTIWLRRRLIKRQHDQVLFHQRSDKNLLLSKISTIGLPYLHTGRVLEDVLVVYIQRVVKQDVHSEVQLIPGKQLELEHLALSGRRGQELLWQKHRIRLFIKAHVVLLDRDRDGPVLAIDPIVDLVHDVSEVEGDQSVGRRI